MARGAWDRTAALRLTVAAALGGKDLDRVPWNPLRPVERLMGTMDDLIGAVGDVVEYGPRPKRKGKG